MGSSERLNGRSRAEARRPRHRKPVSPETYIGLEPGAYPGAAGTLARELLSNICLVTDFEGTPGYRGALSDAELRLLPLLTTQLSLNQIAEALDIPRGVAVAMAQSIYAKLGPLGEDASRRLRSV
jgi:hypothetical protein